MDTCIECKQPGEFICFCSEVTLCGGCISSHLKQQPLTEHRPVTLGKVAADSLEEKLAAIENKINQELRDLDSFEALGVKFAQQLVTTTEQYLERTAGDLSNLVRSRCKTVRDKLLQGQEACRGLGQSNEVSAHLMNCSSAEEVNKSKLLNKQIDFNEIDIHEILAQAFTFEVLFTGSSPKLELTPQKTRRFSDTSIKNLPSLYKGEEKPQKIRIKNLDRLAQPKKQICPFLYNFDYTRGTRFTVNTMSGDVQRAQLPKQEIGIKGSVWTQTINGLIIITGGKLHIAKNTTWIYVLGTKEFTICPSMKTARYHHAAVAINDHLYVFGGFNRAPLAECERYSISNRKWQKMRSMKVSRSQHSVAINHGKVYIFGGARESSIEAYDTQTNSFELIHINLPSPGPTISVLLDNEILLVASRHLIKFNAEHRKLEEIGNVEEQDWWSPTESIGNGRYAYFMWQDSVFRLMVEEGVVGLFKSLND